MTKPYTLSPVLNPNKAFILQKSELEKRWDPFYSIPELLHSQQLIDKTKAKLTQASREIENILLN